MEIANELLKAALLGSDKLDAPSLRSRLPNFIQDQQVQLSADDAEEELLQLSALALPYYRAGRAFPVMNSVARNLAPEEERPYASEAAHQLLKTLLSEQRTALVNEWLEQCAKQSLVVSPPFFPSLLALSEGHVALQHRLMAVMGKRGTWLANLNEAWAPLLQSAQVRWETEKAAYRKQLFAYLLHDDPVEAKTLLQASWKEESANDCLDFIKAWANHVGPEDVPFLETLLTDKSKKVQEQGLLLLLQQANSQLAQEIRQACSSLLTVQRSLLGAKKVDLNLGLDLLPIVKRLGLEKESINQRFSDQEYQAYQVVAVVDPTVWESALKMSPEKILQQFVDQKNLHQYVPAWASAIAFHQNRDWAKAWLQTISLSNVRYEQQPNDTLALLRVVSPETLTDFLERKPMMSAFNANDTINLLTSFDFAWPLAFSRAALRLLHRSYAERGVYYYEKDQFLSLAAHLHPQIEQYQQEFAIFTDKTDSTWQNALQELLRIIAQKASIYQVFST